MAYTTVPKSSAYFDTKLYNGSGSTQSITGLDFQPDWVWIKRRSSARGHTVFDALRGATYGVYPNLTSAQSAGATSLTAFNSDGFTLGSDDRVSGSGHTMVSWNWKGGTTSGIATNGSTQITPSSYSFNQTSGFSIIQYTGIGGTPKAIAHGLGVQPKMFIIKRTNTTGSWGVLPQQISTGHLYLDGTQTLQTVNPLSGGVLADTVNFSVSGSSDVNGSGSTHIAYCFADVQGFSKMGSYTGSGNASGPFCFTGMKPSFVMIKNTTASASWNITDAKRDTFNVAGKGLFANETTAESAIAGREIDFLSNGFKIRTSGGEKNTSGNIYIYMAFAEAPLVASNNVPTTAR